VIFIAAEIRSLILKTKRPFYIKKRALFVHIDR
jgi:hypothetical protein